MIEVCRPDELSPEHKQQWEELRRAVYPPDVQRVGGDLRWAPIDPADDFIRLQGGGRLIACAWVTERTVKAGGRDAHVAGIRGVMTHPDERRHGYGRVVMQRAHELMRLRPACEFGLLFSSPMAAPFYEALGWRTLDGPVICEGPTGDPIDYTARIPAPVMGLTLRADTQLPAGPIDIRGLPW